MIKLINGILISLLIVSPVTFADSVVKKTTVYNNENGTKMVKQKAIVKHHRYHHEGFKNGRKTGWHHRDVQPGVYKKTTKITKTSVHDE